MTLSLHRVHYHILAGYKGCTQRPKDVDRSSIYSSFLVLIIQVLFLESTSPTGHSTPMDQAIFIEFYKHEKEGFRSSRRGSADVYEELAKYQQSILEIGIRALVSLRAPLWKSRHKHYSS